MKLFPMLVWLSMCSQSRECLLCYTFRRVGAPMRRNKTDLYLGHSLYAPLLFAAQICYHPHTCLAPIVWISDRSAWYFIVRLGELDCAKGKGHVKDKPTIADSSCPTCQRSLTVEPNCLSAGQCAYDRSAMLQIPWMPVLPPGIESARWYSHCSLALCGVTPICWLRTEIWGSRR